MMRCSNRNAIMRVLACLIIAFVSSLLYSVLNVPRFSVNYGEMLRGNRLITWTVTSTGEIRNTTYHTSGELRTTLSYHTTGVGESNSSSRSNSSAVPPLPLPPSARGAACVTTVIGPHLSVDDHGSLCDTFHIDIGDTMCCQPHAAARHDCSMCQFSSDGVYSQGSDGGTCCSSFHGCISCCVGKVTGTGTDGRRGDALLVALVKGVKTKLLPTLSRSPGDSGYSDIDDMSPLSLCKLRCRNNSVSSKNIGSMFCFT